MNRLKLCILIIPMVLTACSSIDNRGTIAQLRHRQIEINEAEITGGLEKAMESYQRFLAEAKNSVMAPEAIRRLADLKVEKEYGFVSPDTLTTGPNAELPPPEPGPLPQVAQVEPSPAMEPGDIEAEVEFERRATASAPLVDTSSAEPLPDQPLDDLEKAGPLEAIGLYQRLLDQYPLYQRNDQVLYQMSRAYEELGRIDEAMEVMERLVREFPQSRYIDEVQFRRAEYFFSHRQFLEAEEAYTSIVALGVGSSYFPLSLYKLGWTFYKQELYEEALHKFMALLDHKLSTGYDFEQTEDETEHKRLNDTFRVISLGFSYLGGAESVVEYFSSYGRRDYEDSVYNNLGEYYFAKRRYSDAVATYSAFVSRNLFHEKSPLFHRRIIEINMAGGFPSLVIEAKKSFATNYGLKAAYWQHFEPGERPDVIAFLKTNLTDLANHYHALYQNPKRSEEKPLNFNEALHWYREFLGSFPLVEESPAINYQLADLLLENRSFAEAAVEYEKTAYSYEPHEQSSKAGYAAVYAYRQQLDRVTEETRTEARREVIRSSLTFAATFPGHEKAAVVLGAAADDLFFLEEHEQALLAAWDLIEIFPETDAKVRRSAWLVIAHSSYELELYSEAESAYVAVLALLPDADPVRTELFDNLAAAIYRQGEAANAYGDHAAAADHFLRVGRMAPTSKLRSAAEYDAAVALIKLKDWSRAATVLNAFRRDFPGHELQPEVTKKIAYVYREDGKLSLAAVEYEQIERESSDVEVRREALLIAAELHEQSGSVERTLEVYRRYVDYFPRPLEMNVEIHNKIAEIFKKRKQQGQYLEELRRIVAIDAGAADLRTERTRFLASKAALVLAERNYEAFVSIALVKPFDVNLRKKQKLMKISTQAFGRLLDYEVGEVTAAATFYMAEIYAHFSRSLMTSERPDGLEPLELEEYELAIEEQAYPFEERAIEVHESNLQLLSLGVYNEWIDKSLERLARFVPARYAKTEEVTAVMTSLDNYSFVLAVPLPPPSMAQEQTEGEPAALTEVSDSSMDDEPATIDPPLETESDPVVPDDNVAEIPAAGPLIQEGQGE